MLTLVVDGRTPCLGELKGCADAGSNDAPRVELSELGSAILNEEIQKIHHFYPMIDVWRVCIMPDHIHMIVRVSEDMPKGKHLGMVLKGFKTGCSRAWWRIQDEALVRENGFPKLYKPYGENFYACSEGLLLQISPWEIGDLLLLHQC